MDSQPEVMRRFPVPGWLLFAANLALIGALTALAPTERTLGANIRLILLHGVWVWAGLLTFLAAALSGLAGLLRRQRAWQAWSLALGRTGLAFWLTYLPMSLLVMQINWGGLYFDEPRWRIPFAFAVAGTLLQVALGLFNRLDWAAGGNLVFGAALWAATLRMENILHPDAPILSPTAGGLQVFFVVLLGLELLLAFQVARWFFRRIR
ncbi:MAG TPA: hypothetical protein VHO48_09095 [Anaerolineaceae bacterium]|nr:hypothetical protein [Anaerolineaceae bacterium]